MKTFILFLAILVPTFTPAIDLEHKLHFAGSAAISLGAYSVCRGVTSLSKWECAITAGSTMAAIGIIKETGDNNTFVEHMSDMGVNLLGISVGLGIALPF